MPADVEARNDPDDLAVLDKWQMAVAAVFERSRGPLHPTSAVLRAQSISRAVTWRKRRALIDINAAPQRGR
jgi:hypothetical protein